MNFYPPIILLGERSKKFRTLFSATTKNLPVTSNISTPEINCIPVKQCHLTGNQSKKFINSLITAHSPATNWIILEDTALLGQIITRVMFLTALEKHQFSFIPGTATVNQYFDTANPVSQKNTVIAPTNPADKTQEELDINSYYCSPIEPHSIATLSDLASYFGCAKPQGISLPIIRDEAGKIIFNTVKIYPPLQSAKNSTQALGKEKFFQRIFSQQPQVAGEAYVDEKRLATNIIHALEISPMATFPGLMARSKNKRKFLPGFSWTSWVSGRAVQVGGEDFIVEFPGKTQYHRTLTTFYRHHEMMNIVYW